MPASRRRPTPHRRNGQALDPPQCYRRIHPHHRRDPIEARAEARGDDTYRRLSSPSCRSQPPPRGTGHIQLELRDEEDRFEKKDDFWRKTPHTPAIPVSSTPRGAIFPTFPLIAASCYAGIRHDYRLLG